MKVRVSQIEAMEKLGKTKQDEIIATALSAPAELAILARALARGEKVSTLVALRDEFLTAAERTVRYEVRVNPGEETVEEQTDSVFSRGMDAVGGVVGGVTDFIFR